jgi:hypothetical protein
MASYLVAQECSSDQQAQLATLNGTVKACRQVRNLTQNRKQFIVAIRQIEKNSELQVGLEIFEISNLHSPIFQQNNLGQIAEPFLVNGHSTSLLIQDIDRDGIIDIGIKALNERTATLHIFSYTPILKQFVSKSFVHEKGDRQQERLDFLVASLDFPIEIKKSSIKVFFSATKFITYLPYKGMFYQSSLLKE